MGYTGGTTDAPTYEDLGDHTETVQIDYDPSVISYEELLLVFFAGHDAACGLTKRQYMSAIFFHDEVQERLARQAKAQEESRLGQVVQTQILPATTFYPAEDYHQKYALQGDPLLMREFWAIYPDFADIVASTAAARVNAYLSGCGTRERLQAQLDDLGLSEEAAEHLLSVVR